MKELENRLIGHVYNNINMLCSKEHIWKSFLEADPAVSEVRFQTNESFAVEDIEVKIVEDVKEKEKQLFYSFEVLFEVSGEYYIWQKDITYSQQSGAQLKGDLKLKLSGKALPGEVSNQPIQYKLELVSWDEKKIRV